MRVNEWLKKVIREVRPVVVVVRGDVGEDEEITFGRTEQIGMLSSALATVMHGGVHLVDQATGTVLDSVVKRSATEAAESICKLIKKLADAEYEELEDED